MNEQAGTYRISRVEWPTLLLIAASYSIWLLLAIGGGNLPAPVWIIASAINVTLFMSITHEVLHGHPTRNASANRFLVLFPLGWSLPYERFRDTHLQHHNTGELTDPFDDPESWYLSPRQWRKRNPVLKMVLIFNNTLFGRMLIGPVVGLGTFYVQELALFWRDRGSRTYLARVWAQHLLLCFLMAWFIANYSTVPAWQWLVSVYAGHSVLLIRTYLEHQASPEHGERTVIIEKPCPIAFLFLFNNYHFVHHDRPGLPWYRLPREYRARRRSYVERNGAYVYRSYAEVFGKFLFRSKEPVPHPFLRADRQSG